MRILKLIAVVLGMIAGVVITTRAEAAVTVNFDPGTTNVTTALTGYQTYGDMMAGMQLTAKYTDGSVQTATWATTGYHAGSAFAAGYLFVEQGDTFSSPWTLTNQSTTVGLVSLAIDAGPGNTVFDTQRLGDVTGTPGSERGWNFTVQGTTPFDIVATYRDAVALTGHSWYGDLFRRLDVQFTNNGGMTAGSALQFVVDTDNIKFAGDIHPVPLPAAVWTGMFLLGGLGVVRKVRKQK
jgi:hypothetical protein